MKVLDRSKASFDALVDLLLAHGNEIVGERWHNDSGGRHTQMKRPIDWALVYGHFSIDHESVLVLDNSITTMSEAYEVIYRR